MMVMVSMGMTHVGTCLLAIDYSFMAHDERIRAESWCSSVVNDVRPLIW